MASHTARPVQSSGKGNLAQPELNRLMNVDEVAEFLGVDVRHVRRLVHERRIPYIKWGHLLRFDPAEMAAWLEGHRRRPA